MDRVGRKTITGLLIMLEIETYIHKSKIAGNGVFTAHAVPKGTVVWKESSRNTVIIPDDKTHPNRLEYIFNYGYLIDDGWVLCADNAKFMNHSESPNLIEVTIDGLCVNIAACDIAADEELTCNYWHFDKDASRKLSG